MHIFINIYSICICIIYIYIYIYIYDFYIVVVHKMFIYQVRRPLTHNLKGY